MTTKKISMSKVLPVLFTFLVMGFVDIVGISVGYAKKEFNLSDTIAQLLPAMVFLWFLILSVPFGIMQDRKGKKKVMNLGIIVTGLGMLLGFFSYSFPILLVAFVLLGIGNTIVQVAANPLIQDVTSKEKLSSFVSWGQFLKAIVPAVAPPLFAFVAKQFGDWKFAFLIYAIASLFALIWLSTTKIKEYKPEGEPATFQSCFKLLANRFVLIMVFGIFVIVGIDVGMNTNIQNLLQSKFNMSLENASYGIMTYFIASTISRFSGAVILNWIKPKKFLITGTIIVFVGLACILFSTSPLLVQTGIFLIGIGVGNLFSVVFSIAINRLPERANEIAGLMVMAIVGGAVIPPIMGIVSTGFGAVASFIVLVICAFYLLGISLGIKND